MNNAFPWKLSKIYMFHKCSGLSHSCCCRILQVVKVTAWCCCDALEECHWALSEQVEALKNKWFGQSLLHSQNHKVIVRFYV